MNDWLAKLLIILLIVALSSDTVMAMATRRVSVSVNNNENHQGDEYSLARNRAYNEAIGLECGVYIYSSSKSLNFSKISNYFNKEVVGIVISDSLIKTSTLDTVINQVPIQVFDYEFDVTLECVEQIQPDFSVKIKMETEYNHNDELSAKIYPSRRLYLYVFNITLDGNVQLIYPNYFFHYKTQQKQFDSNDPLTTPFFGGVSMPLQNDTGQHAIDMLTAVATENEYSLLSRLSGNSSSTHTTQSLTFDQFNEWLHSIPNNRRSTDHKQYHLSKK